MKILKYAGVLIAIACLALLGYGGTGYWAALSDADVLGAHADELISGRRGGDSLGVRYRDILITVEDPNFWDHSGLDISTPGAGLTTITQSLAKRVAFDEFRPGLRKIRQTGYALGLEVRLSKAQILALWLDTLEMGEGPNGWIVGFHDASAALYGRPPASLTETQFIRLVAVLIAPASFNLTEHDTALDERTSRIQRLIAGVCGPTDNSDVWLDGCRSPSDEGVKPAS
ncbi:glycosyl transferase [Rhodovulum sulfidophilum]|uniref:biosynthetic peptidoglycan transglycosylase n=1 Tax=Rhodovulum sulfidophilum TaxID=35806 RepID=UPI0019137017|nr:biosynthetic peptidoglycan transglycosylase [Rhodovulum sulfidophilum]MBK5923702.1 glycosyl transferase [Rhodovulum sulfidophilum]